MDHPDEMVKDHTAKIQDITAALRRIDEHQREFKAHQDRQTVILERIADHQATITAMGAQLTENKKDVNELFARVRGVEILSAENATYIRDHREMASREIEETRGFRTEITTRLLAIEKAIDIVGFTKSKVGQTLLLLLAGLILINAYVNFKAHYEIVKEVWQFWK